MHYALDWTKDTFFVSFFAWIYAAMGILKVLFVCVGVEFLAFDVLLHTKDQ